MKPSMAMTPSRWTGVYVVICGPGMILTAMSALAACQASHNQPAAQTAGSQQGRVEAVLDRLEQSGLDLKDLQAELKYSILQLIKANPGDPDDIESFVGTIKLSKASEPPAFFIHFKRKSEGRVPVWLDDQQQWFIFDGMWLTHASQGGQSIRQEQIIREGESTELFRLGKGPFPMPFGQKKKDILEQFEVRLGGSTDELPSCDHLICIPKADSQIGDRYEQIDLFICNDTSSELLGLVLKIIALNKKDATQETATFTKFKLNRRMKPEKAFKLPSFTKKWDLTRKPLPPSG